MPFLDMVPVSLTIAPLDRRDAAAEALAAIWP